MKVACCRLQRWKNNFKKALQLLILLQTLGHMSSYIWLRLSKLNEPTTWRPVKSLEWQECFKWVELIFQSVSVTWRLTFPDCSHIVEYIRPTMNVLFDPPDILLPPGPGSSFGSGLGHGAGTVSFPLLSNGPSCEKGNTVCIFCETKENPGSFGFPARTNWCRFLFFPPPRWEQNSFWGDFTGDDIGLSWEEWNSEQSAVWWMTYAHTQGSAVGVGVESRRDSGPGVQNDWLHFHAVCCRPAAWAGGRAGGFRCFQADVALGERSRAFERVCPNYDSVPLR